MQESEVRDLEVLANQGEGGNDYQQKGGSGIAKSRTTGKKITVKTTKNRTTGRKITGKITGSNVTCCSDFLRVLLCPNAIMNLLLFFLNHQYI